MQVVKNEIQAGEEVPVLFCVLSDKTPEGEFMAMIIDPLDGRPVVRANSESVAEAKFVLGCASDSEYTPSEEYYHENVELAEQVKNILVEAFPEGYKLEWIGLWRNDPRTVKLCGWLDGQEIPQDAFFDYVVPERVVKQNAERAAQARFAPDPAVWNKKQSKDFYLGMASACRILAANVMQAKNQKEIVQFINNLSLSAMVIADEKKAAGPKLIL